MQKPKQKISGNLWKKLLEEDNLMKKQYPRKSILYVWIKSSARKILRSLFINKQKLKHREELAYWEQRLRGGG